MKGSFNFIVKGLIIAAILCYTGLGTAETTSARQRVESENRVVTSEQIKSISSSSFSFDKGTTQAKLDNNTETVSVSNRNGTIEIKQGTVKNIEIQTTVQVDQAITREEAKAAADKVKLLVKAGKTLDIEAYSASYGKGKMYYPSIHLSITLPQGLKADLEAEQVNGNPSLSKVTSVGKVKLSTENGNVTANGIGNEISLETVNGIIRVTDAKKSVRASVTNGNIQADRIVGSLDMKTTNGNLSSKDANASIKAVTTAGNITVESNKVGGDWMVSSSVGNVELSWPEKASVKVDGTTTFGEIETDFPLKIKNKRATGTFGAGTYQIQAECMAGLSLMKTS